MKIPEKNKMKDEIYRKARSTYGSMISRCYNKNDSSYKYYGDKGVHVCERWLEFENFYEDIDKIDGWDKELYKQGELSLDKDYKIKGNKEYSLDNCCFISKELNNKLKPTQQREIISMTPEGKIIKFMNQSDFSKKHNLQLSGIHNCLKGKWKHTKKWQFSYLDEYYEGKFLKPHYLIRTIVGLSPEGKLYEFNNATEFAKEHDLLEATVIYGCANLKNTHTRGWQFRFKDELKKEPFLDYKDLNIVGKRNVKVKAIDPEGNVWYTKNRSKFAREHNLDRHKIKKVLDGKIKDTNGWVFLYD